MVLHADETLSSFAVFADIFVPGKLLDCFKCFYIMFYI